MFVKEKYETILAPIKTSLETEIQAMINTNDCTDEQKKLLIEAVGQGRRFRSLLLILSCQINGGHWQQAIQLASCVELLHKASLIHDDIQDRDEFRRNAPTFWVKHGDAIAIAIGDLLVAIAIKNAAKINWQYGQKMLDLYFRLCKGQLNDLLYEQCPKVSDQEIEEMLADKAGILLAASMQYGACVANASQENQDLFEKIGMQLGIAFQIINDINNLNDVDLHSKGKIGQDQQRHKKNYVSQENLAHAQLKLTRTFQQYEQYLDMIPTNPLTLILRELRNESSALWFWVDSDQNPQSTTSLKNG